MPIFDNGTSQENWRSWVPHDFLEDDTGGEQEIIDTIPRDLQSDEQIQAEISRLYQQAEKKGAAQGLARGIEEGKQQGYDEGFLLGKEAGIEEGRQEAIVQQQQAVARFESWSEEFRITLDHLDSVIPARLLQLALVALRSLLGNGVVCDSAALLEKIKVLLHKEVLFKGKSQLWVHADDLPMIQSQVGESLAKLGWEINIDPQMHPGGCRLTSEEGEFDAAIATAWQDLCQLGCEGHLV